MRKLNVTDRQTDGQTDGRMGGVAISPVPGPTARREIINPFHYNMNNISDFCVSCHHTYTLRILLLVITYLQ